MCAREKIPVLTVFDFGLPKKNFRLSINEWQSRIKPIKNFLK